MSALYVSVSAADFKDYTEKEFFIMVIILIMGICGSDCFLFARYFQERGTEGVSFSLDDVNHDYHD